MLSILRQMTIEELRYAAVICGAHAEASPEGIMRALCRECSVLGWGFVPLTREDALFEQVGQRLGVPPGPKGPVGVPVMERRVYRALLRHAWEMADPLTQRRVLEEAVALWGSTGGTAPELPLDGDPLSLSAALEGFINHSAGLLALAGATERVPLPFPQPLGMPFMHPLNVAVGNLTGVRPRADRGYPVLFEVLTLCWRSRRRLLNERRVLHVQVERQIRQLAAAMQQRAEELREGASPWAQNVARGAAVAGGAIGATWLQLMLDVSSPWGWLAAGAGLAYGAFSWVTQPRVEHDPRYARLQAELARQRQQLAAVRNSVRALEGE